MGDVSMRRTENEDETVSRRQRELIVAYLSYAIEDVRAVSETGLHLLQMTIAALSGETAAANSRQEAPNIFCH